MDDIILIKLGGSLITDKDKAFTARNQIIHSLALELSQIQQQFPNKKIIIGHGSGSFGHNVAREFNTRSGVNTEWEWTGFFEVWKAARSLHQIVLDEFIQVGLHCFSFPPSANMIATNGVGSNYFITPLIKALSAGVIPVVYGDVVFDDQIGGTILSTEDVFFYLTRYLNISAILLAGIEEGIWYDVKNKKGLIPEITPKNFLAIQEKIGASASPDVTGGMIEKVRIMLRLLENNPALKIKIFSGNNFGNLTSAIQDQDIGTRIRWE